MHLKLIISDNCEACIRAEKILKSVKKENPFLCIEVIHINSFHDRRISITPALLIDDKLFSYGDIDNQKLLLKLNKG
jgi:hypothetical protein